jgi:hypothetical protein
MYSVVFDPRNRNRITFTPYAPKSASSPKRKSKPKPNWLMKTLQDYADAQVKKHEQMNRNRKKRRQNKA